MVYRVSNIIDDLPKGNGSYTNRAESSITDVVIHHSAAPPKFDAYDFAKWHTEQNGWPAIGYHYVIMPDGSIFKTNHHYTKSYQTGGHNTYTLGICLAGNFEKYSPPSKQIAATVWLIKRLKKEIPSIDKINPHGHYKGTSCPGKLMPMNEIRQRVNSDDSEYMQALAVLLAVIGFTMLAYAFYLITHQ